MYLDAVRAVAAQAVSHAQRKAFFADRFGCIEIHHAAVFSDFNPHNEALGRPASIGKLQLAQLSLPLRLDEFVIRFQLLLNTVNWGRCGSRYTAAVEVDWLVVAKRRRRGGWGMAIAMQLVCLSVCLTEVFVAVVDVFFSFVESVV